METLFNGTVEFEDKKDLENMVSILLDKEMAIKLIEIALSHAHSSGSFNLTESHVIYKCISKLKE